MGQPFGNNPAPGPARGDQHHPELPFVKPEGQGTNLLAWLAPRFVRLWIGYWCRPINSDRFRHFSSGHQVSLTCGALHALTCEGAAGAFSSEIIQFTAKSVSLRQTHGRP